MTDAPANPNPLAPPDAIPAGQDGAATRRRRGPLARLARGVAGLLWTCLGLAVAASLFAWLYPSDLHEELRPLVLLNAVAFAADVLRFHLSVACGVGAGLALLVLRWRLAVACAVAGIVLASPTMLSWLPKHPPPVAGTTLRVQSMNLLFDNYRPSDLFAALDAVDADVIVMQEFHTWHDRFVTGHLAAKYPYSVRFASEHTMGMAVFSRTPILAHTPAGEDVRVGPNLCRMQRAVIEHEGRAIAVWNVHPTSPGGPRAFAAGQRQTADLVDALAAEALPHVVAGDFNAATGTANLGAFRDAGLTEAQSAAGVGPGWTWPRQKKGRILKYFARLPGLRIDQCFYSRELTATHAEVGPYHGSDHLSVVADLGWRR